MNTRSAVFFFSLSVPIVLALGCTDGYRGPTIGQTVEAFGSLGDEVELFQSGYEPFPGIISAIDLAGCGGGTSNCSDVAWIGSGSNPTGVTITLAPLCEDLYSDGGTPTPLPSPCWNPDGARPLPSFTGTPQGSAVVAFYPDDTQANAVLALVNDNSSVEVTPVGSSSPAIIPCTVDSDCSDAWCTGCTNVCLDGYCAVSGLSECDFPDADPPCWGP